MVISHWSLGGKVSKVSKVSEVSGNGHWGDIRGHWESLDKLSLVINHWF